MINKIDMELFHAGRHTESYTFMGAHYKIENDKTGTRFTVWAPNALNVYVIGSFNNWTRGKSPLEKITQSKGIWSGFIEGVSIGDTYKYEIHTAALKVVLKADPYAFYVEKRPDTASIVIDDSYCWQDYVWQNQEKCYKFHKPLLIYEVHLGSWRRKADGSFMSYRELVHELVPYVIDMGYTHLELMPLTEYPLDESWGYQVTGYYAVTSRYGTNEDFKYFIDYCHQNGVGVILDWVPGHFCKDEHGLREFDGQCLYESALPERAESYGWGTLYFDFSKQEVRSFLLSNAMFWLKEYHLDGLRIDAVASMLYLDYDRKDGRWIPNMYGKNENLEAISFMQILSEKIAEEKPYSLLIAEESTAWPLVTKPGYLGGLGYNYKWNMGWMNDILKYMSLDPIHRKWQHNLITFSLMYAYAENFILVLSHDEVVHGKKSLLDKMPGDYWQKFANLRAFYLYFMTHPGKKLLFMGGEIGQFSEWSEQRGLDFNILDYEMHRKLKLYLKKLNHLYREKSALWELDCQVEGFSWIDCHDYTQSVISFIRKDKSGNYLIIVINFTPVVRENYRIGVEELTSYHEILNSDLETFGGSNIYNDHEIRSIEIAWHEKKYSISLTLPPLGALILEPSKKKEGKNVNR